METVVLILVLILSVMVHEVAHGLAAERLGDPTARLAGRLTFNPLRHVDPVGTVLVPLILAILPGSLVFGWARPVPVDASNLRRPGRDGALVAAAGPASNLFLATACALLLGVLAGVVGLPGAAAAATAGQALHRSVALLLQGGVVVNVLLAVFNLLPLPPLDGSWIAVRLLPGRARALYLRLRPFGLLILVLLLVGGGRRLLAGAVYAVSGLFFVLSELVAAILA